MNSANANPIAPLHLPTITINEDGRITPETSYLNRTGNIYTLTADLKQQYSIEIKCNNIIFDGGGHLINVTVGGVFDDNGYPAAYVDVGVNLMQVNNVKVKNVQIFSSNNNAPNLQHSNNCQIINVTTNQAIRILGDSNSITECNARITIWKGSNNLITNSTINGFYLTEDNKSNKFIENNIYLKENSEFANKQASASWDNGSIGNYWSNYSIKYPNAHEMGNTGIGNTPYVFNSYNVDNYPLLHELVLPTSLNSQNQSQVPELTTVSLALVGILFFIVIIKMRTKTTTSERNNT